MEVFKKAHKITLKIYEITKLFPQDEKFALISQMRRASYSVPSNSMEGSVCGASNRSLHLIVIASPKGVAIPNRDCFTSFAMTNVKGFMTHHGSHRLNKKEYRQFVGIAKGSVGELKYFLLLSKDLGYIPERDYSILLESVEEISKMLDGLANSLTDTNH